MHRYTQILVAQALMPFAPRYSAVLALLALAGCMAPPDSVPLPAQRQPYTGTEPAPEAAFLEMSDPQAPAYFVRDVSEALEGGGWRWTREHPELRFWLSDTRNWKFRCFYGIVPPAFAQTGPVNLSVVVNGHLLAATHYASPGDYPFEKPVPAAWLKADSFNHVVIQVDKFWVSPVDGARLGFVLYRAGFVQ